VRPDGNYVDLLTNPARKVNADPWVECEVWPPSGNFWQLSGRRVKVVGPLVGDNSHDMKTEIHPVHYLRTVDTPQGSVPGSIDVFVYCISAHWSPTAPLMPDEPFESGRPESYDDSIPMPPQPDADRSVPYIRNSLGSGPHTYAAFTATLSADSSVVNIHVESGVEPAEGMLFAHIELGWELPGCKLHWDAMDQDYQDLSVAIADLNDAPVHERPRFAKEVARISALLSAERNAARAQGCGIDPYIGRSP
jgi:hypothetical protein